MSQCNAIKYYQKYLAQTVKEMLQFSREIWMFIITDWGVVWVNISCLFILFGSVHSRAVWGQWRAVLPWEGRVRGNPGFAPAAGRRCRRRCGHIWVNRRELTFCALFLYGYIRFFRQRCRHGKKWSGSWPPRSITPMTGPFCWIFVSAGIDAWKFSLLF